MLSIIWFLQGQRVKLEWVLVLDPSNKQAHAGRWLSQDMSGKRNFTKGGIPFALELFAAIKNGFPVSTSSMILNTSLGAGLGQGPWERAMSRSHGIYTLTYTHCVLTKSKAELAYLLHCIQV